MEEQKYYRRFIAMMVISDN